MSLKRRQRRERLQARQEDDLERRADDQATEEQTQAEQEDLYAKLQRDYAELKERQQKERAELAAERQRREELEAGAGRAEQDVRLSHKAVLDQALTAANLQAERAEQDLAAAYQAGDGAAMAKAQRAIAAAEFRIQRLTDGKEELERQETEAKRQPAERRPAGDDFEGQIAQFSAPAKAWLRENRDVVTNPDTQRRALSAHHLAVIKGITPDTEEYFEFLEDQLYPDDGAGEDPPPPPPPPSERLGQRRRADDDDERRYAAPPSRASRNGRRGEEGEEIDLTQEQKSYARSMGMTNKEYGKYLLDISKGRSHLRLTKDLN